MTTRFNRSDKFAVWESTGYYRSSSYNLVETYVITTLIGQFVERSPCVWENPGSMPGCTIFLFLTIFLIICNNADFANIFDKSLPFEKVLIGRTQKI